MVSKYVLLLSFIVPMTIYIDITLFIILRVKYRKLTIVGYWVACVTDILNYTVVLHSPAT